MAEQILLIRHGETEWSRNGKHTSHTDLSLTDTGRADALRIVGCIEQPPTTLISSPMKRAVETADLAFGDMTKQLDDRLREWDYGDYEGITTPEIRANRPGWFLWTDGCPNGESPQDVTVRCDALLEHVAGIDGVVALISHGHLLRSLTARYVGLPVEYGKAFELHTGTIGQLGWERDIPTIEMWNRPT